MSYYIDIIDMLSLDNKLVVEQASASGITLSWNGGDTKDDFGIVSSILNFDMLTRTAEDAAFINFFTGDEKRFKVLVKDNATDVIIWQGYILPDLYSEPYKNVSFFVAFGATDGLGRLKGKYLSNEYYNKEKSLVDIFCKILNLIGLEIDLYFSPAIENSFNKDWNDIYLDTINFLTQEKKNDAYTIFETLLKNTLCVCYQADNRWYIEGLNVRQFRSVKYQVYDITTATQIGVAEYDRLLKRVTPLVTPVVTQIPPYNEIVVSHKKITPTFPETIAAEKNDGWAIVSGVVGEVYSTDWIGHGGMLERCLAPDYAPHIFHRGNERDGAFGTVDFPQDNTRFLSLRKKIFYKKGQRINMSFEFGLQRYYSFVPAPEDVSVWKNCFKYEILFNGVVIYGNNDNSVVYFEDLNFDAAGKALLSIDHIFTAEGLFDVKIYGLTGIMQETNLKSISIDKAEINVFGFIEDQQERDLISGEFSIDKEVELTFADDNSGMSPAFRLSRLNQETSFFVRIDVPVIHSFTLDGKFYLQIDLAGVNLIAENLFTVFSALDDSPVEIINTYYNFKDGEQMVVETLAFYDALYVKKYASDDITESRLYWEEWTDVIYKIEKSSYAKIVANIYRRMFNTAVEKIDFVVKNSVKFNDIILFNYVFDKDFFVLNCSWNLDENNTTLTLGRSFYKDVETTAPEDKNIPPIVVAGADIYVNADERSVTFNAAAYDPDGFIVSIVWTKEIGGFGDIIVSPNSLQTVIDNLTEDYYKYKIEVTDNDGATAVDYIEIYRVVSVNASLVLEEENNTGALVNFYKYRKYKLVFDKPLPANAVLSFAGLLKAEVIFRNNADSIIARAVILKNGNAIAFCNIVGGDNPKKVDLSYNFNFIASDEVYFISTNSIKNHNANYSYTEMNLGTYTVVNGNVIVSGLPIQKIESLGTP